MGNKTSLTHRQSHGVLQQAGGCSAGFQQPISVQIHNKSPTGLDPKVLLAHTQLSLTPPHTPLIHTVLLTGSYTYLPF